MNKKYKAEITAYYPSNEGLEGGYLDALGNKLNPNKNTCSCPKEVPFHTKIKILGTHTKYDEQIYECLDRGSAIVVDNDGIYHIDLLMHNKKEANDFGRRKNAYIEILEDDIMEIKKDIMASSRNYTYRSSRTIKYIVIHSTGCVAPCKNFCLNLKNNKCAGSAHYFVKDDEVRQAIEDHNVAWHIGNPGGCYKVYMSDPKNANSLGIEMCEETVPGKCSDKTIAMTGQLTKYLMKKYNIPESRVIFHHSVLSKQCPQYYVNNLPALKKKILGTTNSTVTTPNTSNTSDKQTNTSEKAFITYKYITKYLQQCMNKDYNCKLAEDGYFGTLTQTQVKKHSLKEGSKGQHVVWLQYALTNRGYKLVQDGIFGPATKEALKKYQSSRKLTVDGCAEINTHKAIIKD